MTKAFQDTSSRSGVVEFETLAGTSVRYVAKGLGVWDRYVKHGEVYRLVGRVMIAGRATPQKLWDAPEVKRYE